MVQRASRKSNDKKVRPKSRTKAPVEPRTLLNFEDISPITTNQKKAVDLYKKGKNLFLYGTAGTGKTFLAVAQALKEVLDPSTEYDKLIIVRSVVPVREMGFLPGTDAEKGAVYEAPYQSICTELFGRGDAYNVLKMNNQVQFITSSFIRGVTLRNCIVVVDEIQNMNEQELHSIITRPGDDCKVIFCGDIKQNDLRKEQSGFNRFLGILSRMKSFGLVEFGISDIVRSGLVKEYIIEAERYDNEQDNPETTLPKFIRG
jgi:phosphate starvation-inducible protein PhoH